MVAHHQQIVPLDEPLFGVHAAPWIATGSEPLPGSLNSLNATRPDYCLSTQYEAVWRPLLRALVLNRIAAQVDQNARDRQITDPVAVLKDPNSSHAGDLIMSLVPRSRLIFLIRDGRDVVDSVLDASTGDTWMTRGHGWFNASGERLRLDLIGYHARVWLYQTEAVQHAFAGHDPERRWLVRYEDLLASPVENLGDILAWMGLGMGDEVLRDVVAGQSFSAIPSKERGSGKVFRAATPGLWREHMTPGEQQLVNEVLGEKLAEFGYEA